VSNYLRTKNMNEDKIRQLQQGLRSAFIMSDGNTNLAYKPQFLTNDYHRGQKVLSSIEEELMNCDEFIISVAFITKSGITPLLQTFKELERKGVKGRILTTDYLMFSEPDALKTLDSLENITIKMYCTENGPGFHTKGYIFQKDCLYRIIIGSSNMTQYALTVNKEWNTRVISTAQGEYIQDIKKEFEGLWNDKATLSFEEFFDTYQVKYHIVKNQRDSVRQSRILSLEAYRLRPNLMQVRFIGNLKGLIREQAKRALLISATGDGGIIVPSQAKTA